MDCVCSILRTRLWWCFLLCVLSVGADAATRKMVSMPSGSSVVNGSGTAVKVGPNVRIPGEPGVEYIPRTPPGTPGVPVKVLPTIDFSIPRTIKGIKNNIKGGAAQMAAAAATYAIISALDWVMTDGVATKKIDKLADPSIFCYKFSEQSIGTQCTSPAALAPIAQRFYVGYSYTGPKWSNPDHLNASLVYCKGTDCRNVPIVAVGKCLGTNNSFGDCVIGSLYSPVTDADLDLVDPWVNNQPADFIKQLLKEACQGSLAPARCLQDLIEQTNVSGPATVSGGTKTSTSTFTRSDGTTGTSSDVTTTNYNIKYGPNYFDYTENNTTSHTTDGVKTGESSTSDGEEVVGEEPAEEEQEEAPNPCVSNCSGPEYVDLYKPTTNTKEQELDSYSSRLNSIPIVAAASGLFNVSVSGGACPAWSYHGKLDIYFSSMPIDLTFDFHCLPWFVELRPWLVAIISIGCTFIAIRIGIL